jgi:uridine kinase
VSDALDAVVERTHQLASPWRVGIDGVTAAGKTTVADLLVARLGARAARLTIDDFHRPPPHEYYPDSFDFDAFRAAVLAADGDVVADGVFLHHPALRDLWHLSVFLLCDRQVALDRALARDESWMENARERYVTRYVPGESRYLREVDPAAQADVVIETTDLESMRLVRG